MSKNTEHQDYPLPQADHLLQQDVEVIRDALNKIDQDMHERVQRHVTKIDFTSYSSDYYYPVWFQMPDNRFGETIIEVLRSYYQDGHLNPFREEVNGKLKAGDTHVAGLYAQLRGNGNPWHGDASYLNITRIHQRYENTIRGINFGMKSIARPIDSSDIRPLYNNYEDGEQVSCSTLSGFYLRGGLTYQVVTNSGCAIQPYTGQNQEEQSISQSQAKDQWQIKWCVKPYPIKPSKPEDVDPNEVYAEKVIGEDYDDLCPAGRKDEVQKLINDAFAKAEPKSTKPLAFADEVSQLKKTVEAQEKQIDLLQDDLHRTQQAHSHLLLSKNQKLTVENGRLKGFNTLTKSDGHFEASLVATVHIDPARNKASGEVNQAIVDSFRKHVTPHYVNGFFNIVRIKWKRGASHTHPMRIDDNWHNGFQQACVSTGAYIKLLSGNLAGEMTKRYDCGDGWAFYGHQQLNANINTASYAPHSKLCLSQVPDSEGELLMCLFGTVSGYVNFDDKVWGLYPSIEDLAGVPQLKKTVEAQQAQIDQLKASISN